MLCLILVAFGQYCDTNPYASYCKDLGCARTYGGVCEKRAATQPCYCWAWVNGILTNMDLKTAAE